MHKSNRMNKELEILQKPPPGISCWPCSETTLDHFEAQIVGGKGTPYEGGVFHLDVKIPDRYPFEPPKVIFLTAIYHPNVDTAGRICLDLLKMPPGGSWKPSWNISTLLTSIQLLMSDPNPDDPLMADIATEFKCKKSQFECTAREWTKKHAIHIEKTGLQTNRDGDSDTSGSNSESEEDEQPKENNLKPVKPGNKLALRKKFRPEKRTLMEPNRDPATYVNKKERT